MSGARTARERPKHASHVIRRAKTARDAPPRAPSHGHHVLRTVSVNNGASAAPPPPSPKTGPKTPTGPGGVRAGGFRRSQSFAGEGVAGGSRGLPSAAEEQMLMMAQRRRRRATMGALPEEEDDRHTLSEQIRREAAEGAMLQSRLKQLQNLLSAKEDQLRQAKLEIEVANREAAKARKKLQEANASSKT